MGVFPDTRVSSTVVSAERSETCEMTRIMRSLPRKAVILGLISAALASERSHAEPWQAPEAAPAASVARPEPSTESAAAAFLEARRWLDDGARGPAVATPPDVQSAAVVLRLRGRIVGLGHCLSAAKGSSAVDLALRAAMDDARNRRAAPTADDRTALARSVTLELELSGPREPMIGRTFEEVARSIEPGECGLAMVDGTRSAYEPVSQLLARRMASPMSRAVLAMVTELGLPPRELPELQELGGATAIYSVHGIRLAQVAPDGMPFVLARALPAVQPEPARPGDAARLAAAAIGRLAAQLAVPPAADGLPPEAVAQMARTGLRGDYAIAADRYEPFAAGPAEQALCAWALARASSQERWPEPVRAQARSAAERVLAALREVDPTERAPTAEPAAVAYAILAAADAPLAGTNEFADSLAVTLATLVKPASLAGVRPHVRVAILDAAAARTARGTPVVEAPELERVLGEALQETPAAELPLVAPIAFDAFRRLRGDGWTAGVAAQRTRLEAARTVLLATQVRPDDGRRAASLADMPGAYPMAGSAAGRISAQSLRAQVFVAMMAGQPAWRSADRDTEDRASLGWATRFVDQLSAPPRVAYCAPAPERALGGILASPADAAQPVAAQAMALLALVETEAALSRLSTAAGAPNPAQSGPNP